MKANGKNKKTKRERERENKGSKKNAARGVVRVVTCLDATAHPSSSIVLERERDLFVIPSFPQGKYLSKSCLFSFASTNIQKPFSRADQNAYY